MNNTKRNTCARDYGSRYARLVDGWKVHIDINHKHYIENNLVCIANNVPNPI